MNANGWLYSAAGSIVLLLVLAVSQVHAIVDQLTLASLVQESEVVVTGKVVTISVDKDATQASVFGFEEDPTGVDVLELVSVDLSVNEVLKGTEISGSLTLMVLQGEQIEGIHWSILDDYPKFTIGEEVCVFLQRFGAMKALTPTAGVQGKFIFQGETVVTDPLSLVENGISRGVFLSEVRRLIAKGTGQSSVTGVAEQQSWGSFKWRFR